MRRGAWQKSGSRELSATESTQGITAVAWLPKAEAAGGGLAKADIEFMLKPRGPNNNLNVFAASVSE